MCEHCIVLVCAVCHTHVSSVCTCAVPERKRRRKRRMTVAECCIALSFVQFLRDLSTAAAQPGNKGSGNKQRNHEEEKEEEEQDVCMHSSPYSTHNT